MAGTLDIFHQPGLLKVAEGHFLENLFVKVREIDNEDSLAEESVKNEQ